MPDLTDSPIPLAAHRKALREAERAALTKLADRFRNGELYASGDGTLTREAELFRDREFPEPEPELRWVPIPGAAPGAQVAYKDGAIVSRFADRPDVLPYLVKEDVDLVRSLLPREPVAVTEAMVEKAQRGLHPGLVPSLASMRAALLAVAADLAGPVGEKPKATPDSDDLIRRERRATNVALHALVWNKRSLRNVPGGWQVAPEFDDHPNASPPYCVQREPGGPIVETALGALLEWHRGFLSEHFPHAAAPSSSEVADT